jgi:diguanylate cyclase (GGDEF)-like protein
VADPAPAAREAVERALSGTDHRVAGCEPGELLARIESERPVLVLVEPFSSAGGGLELIAAVKKKSWQDNEFRPILALTARPDPGSRADALAAGADDAVSRPFDAQELRERVAALLRTKRLLDEAMRHRSELEEAATHDTLTGLNNQRYLTTRLDEEFRRSQRYQEPLALLTIDLDGFEQVNGRFGRGAGDRLLAACAKAIAATCREVDIVTRAGGDEFVVVLPNTAFTGSVVAAERLWRAIRETSVDTGAGAAARCDVSVGACCYPGRDVASPTDLLRFAHAALARAKAEGRGRICLYQHQGYLYEPMAQAG